MKKIFLPVFALMLLAGCVSFPEGGMPKQGAVLPAGPEPEAFPAPAKNASEPNQLAPLPRNTSNIAPRPKAITLNATNTSAPQPKTVQKGWTTESLSIEEGETKYVYIKQ